MPPRGTHKRLIILTRPLSWAEGLSGAAYTRCVGECRPKPRRRGFEVRIPEALACLSPVFNRD